MIMAVHAEKNLSVFKQRPDCFSVCDSPVSKIICQAVVGKHNIKAVFRFQFLQKPVCFHLRKPGISLFCLIIITLQEGNAFLPIPDIV